jgi:hypothetical protein
LSLEQVAVAGTVGDGKRYKGQEKEGKVPRRERRRAKRAWVRLDCPSWSNWEAERKEEEERE